MTPHEMLNKIEAGFDSSLTALKILGVSDKEANEALALIAQLSAALPQWRPIETHDNPSARSFLVFDASNKCQYVVYFRDNILRHFESDRIFRGKPTHFMPLPPSPEGK